MKRCDVFGNGHELLSPSSFRVCVRLKISFCIRLGRSLLCEDLHISCSLRSGVFHQLRIVRLSIFLARLSLGELLVQ